MVDSITAYGSKVEEGNFEKDKRFRVVRNGKVHLDDLKAFSLKSFTKEVDIIRKGAECGISFQDNPDILKGDVIQCYEVHEA